MKYQRLIPTVFLLFAASEAVAQTQAGSHEIYKDQNGYFVAVSPSGWRTQGFPTETVRSKVRFNHPTLNGVYIGVIAAASPRTSYSLDDVLTENRQKTDAVRRTVPGATLTVSKETVAGRNAVLSRIQRGAYELRTVTFIQDERFYQISLNTNSQTQRSAVADTFHAFLRGFTILDPRRAVSDADRKAALLSRYKSLAKLHETTGNRTEALDSVREALELDPQDKELLQMQARLAR
jgi:hypothetical protein